MKKKLLLFLFVCLGFTKGFSQTTAYEAPDIVQCGWEVFNLTQQTPVILGNQDPQFFVVSYFTSISDAEANTNVITNPMQYVAESSNQTIYARVTNLEDDTFDVTDFHIIWNGWEQIPINHEPEPLTVCYMPGEAATVDLTVSLPDIIDEVGDFIVTYHDNGSDAEMGTNPIANPESYVGEEDEYQIYVRFEDPSTGCSSLAFLYVYTVPCTINTISGTLTLDAEGNGCESGGTSAPFVMVLLTNGDTTRYAYTDANGNYTFYNVPDGDNNIMVTGQGAMSYQTEPGEYTVTAPGSFEDQDFCLTAPDPLTDTAVFIYPYFQPRPGFPMSYMLVIQNFGNTTIASGTATFTFDDSVLDYLSSSPAMNLSGNTLTINYSNLEPYTPQYIYINFTVSVNAVVGTYLDASAVISTADEDIDPANNEDVLTQLIVGSYDPNDIACREGESITEEQADGYLHYTIRFQNTAEGAGAADAIFVVIDHDIDSKFDLSTFQPVSASHDYSLRLEDGHLTVRYDDINLPPAEQDEEGSNGYFMYRIKPNSNVQLGDSFEAQASIVFDFNDPIVTNNYVTTIENLAGIKENDAAAFVIYPNPASGFVNVYLNEVAVNAVNVTITDITGKTIVKNKLEMNGSSSKLDISALNSGMYFITLQNGTKTTTKKLIVK